MLSRYRGRTASECAKPAILGLLVSFAVTMLLVAVFALVFVIIERIAESAIVPLALISAGAGCFVGALICARIAKCRGIVYGTIIGIAMFLVIWVIGVFGSNEFFGTDSIVKFFLLTVSGAAGGWVGTNKK